MVANTQFTINATPIRISYVGADCIKLREKPTRKQLKTLATHSQVAYIRVGDGPKAQLFYANKHHQQLIPLSLSQAEMRYFDALVNLPELTFNQARELNLDLIKKIEALTGYQTETSKKVKNIELQVTDQQRQGLLMKLFDGHANAKNATYTYIFQNQLAKYQGTDALAKQDKHSHEINQWVDALHDLSATFIPFESLLQTQSQGSPREILQLLEQQIQTFQHKVNATIEAYLSLHDAAKYPAIESHLKTLKQTLALDCDNFLKQVKTMQHDAITRDELSRLLCVQTRDTNIRALGNFMATQMAAMLDTGIRVTYELSDNRFTNLFHMPDAISALSDAKALIQLKAFSLDGAEYNETYTPIRQEMLDVLTPAKPHEPTESQEKWFSIMPYISHLNPGDLDKTICLATNTSYTERRSVKFYFQLGNWGQSIAEALTQVGLAVFQFVASAIELLLYVPLRLILTLTLLAFELAANTLLSVFYLTFNTLSQVPGLSLLHTVADWFDTTTISDWINQIDNLLSNGHNALSIVKATKRMTNNRYQRLDADGEPVNDDHQKLLRACTEETNFFHQIFVYLNISRISGSVKDFLNSIAETLTNFYKDPLYLFSAAAYRAEPREVYEMVSLRQQLQRLNLKRLQEAEDIVPEEAKFRSVRHLAVNEIASPLEVFREIMLTLDDVVVDPMFRKSPGAATLYCMISSLTLSTYIGPAKAIGWMRSLPNWLQIPTDALSIHFTGKPTSLGLMEQMVACFLEWKLGFFSTELLMEIQRGNFDFLSELVKEPEQMTLGLVGLIGMGIALQYLPLLPTTIEIPHVAGMPSMPPIYNYYAEVFNMFIDEAKGCTAGTIGLTGIEYGFLGLKFAMLMHSMLAGAKPYARQTAFQELSLACSDAKFIEVVIHEAAKINLLSDKKTINIRAKFDAILNQALDTVLTQKSLSEKFSKDDIKAFKKVLKSVVTPDAIREYQNIKNPEYRASEQNKLIQSNETPKARFESTLDTLKANESPIENNAFLKAKNELEAAIALCTDDECPLIFHDDPFKEANKFYDYLDGLFERYNQEAKALNKPELILDKRSYLDVFYNKYCYRGSSNLLRSLLFFPVPIPFPPYYFPGIYLAAAIYRGFKYLIAKWKNKPSVAHQITKSFNKDLVLLMQFVSVIARTGQVAMRAMGYIFRPFIALTLFALTALPYLTYRLVAATGVLGDSSQVMSRKQWFKAIDERASSFTRLHRIRLWEIGPDNWAKPIPTWPWQWDGNDIKKILTWPLRKMRVMYAQSARIAGSSDDIATVAKETLDSLKTDTETVSTTAIDDSYSDTNSEYSSEDSEPKPIYRAANTAQQAHISDSRVSFFNTQAREDEQESPQDEADKSHTRR